MLDEAFPREAIDWNGKVITFARPTLDTQRLFKEELERDALLCLRRKRDLMDAAEYADALRALSRDFTARIYAWGKPEWARCVQDVDWYKRMLWHVLAQRVLPEKQSLNPWLTPQDMDKLWDDMSYPAADGKPAGNLLDDAYGRLMSDPNPKPPTGTTTGDQAAA